jgi:hypothetical protein
MALQRSNHKVQVAGALARAKQRTSGFCAPSLDQAGI